MLRLPGQGFVTLNEYPVAPGAYGYAERLLKELQVLAKTAIEEGKFLFRV